MTSSADLRGFQQVIILDRREVLTLGDVRPAEGGILLVGINPSPPSVELGHYYHGTLGKRLWARMRAIGLLAETGTWEDESWHEAGNGLTDIVKRPTAAASELSRSEIVDGAQVVRSKVREYKPGLILFSFLASAEAVLGFAPPVGRGPLVESVTTFRMEGPYAASEKVRRNGLELKALLDTHGSGD